MKQYYDISCIRKFAEFTDLALNDWEGIVCPKDPGHQRAGKRITPLHLDIASKKVVDFSTTFLSDIVITDHALKTLKDADLTGFRVEPVVLHKTPKGMPPSEIPTLWELIVTGDGGYAHPESGIVVRRQCDACGSVRYSAYERGLIVDENAYDGSDFFTIREYPKHVLVNDRAKSVIKNNGLTNVKFVESSKLEWPEGVNKP
jgi:hypothetical protein